jgi:UDP-N-acetylmuramate-alanine ligase
MNEYAIPEMVDYLKRIGYTPSDLNRLNVVHVTGTKGKGSTCAFVERILRSELPEGSKIGGYPFETYRQELNDQDCILPHIFVRFEKELGSMGSRYRKRYSRSTFSRSGRG